MKQVLHILAKDARHLWGEIFLSLVITATFAWIYPSQWRAATTIWSGRHNGQYVSSYAPYIMEILPKVLMGLVPVSWWLLITNLVHDERLVGDRQFWLTRPYEWKKLLAAKLLFLLVFLYLPFLMAQSYLLAVAGFSPLSFAPGLLFNLVLISCGSVLPLMALAAVTSNFARMTLTLLGVLLAFGLIAALSTRASTEWIMLPGESGFFTALLVCFCVAAVVSQYAMRRTWIAVVLLTALPIAYLSTGCIVTHSQTLINGAYPFPATGSQVFAQLSFNPSAPLQSVAFVPRLPNEVGIQIPLNVSGIANQSVVIPEGVRATIEDANGFRWVSNWQPIYATKFEPDMKTARVAFAMPRPVYDRLRALPLTVRLNILLKLAQVGAVNRISLSERKFTVPDFGVCSPRPSFPEPNEIRDVVCLSALREPWLTQIQYEAHNTDCNSSPVHLGIGFAENTWQGSLEDGLVQPSLSSVKFPFGIFPWTGSSDTPLHLCPGTTITFSRYDLARRGQVSVTIPGFQLPAVTPGQLQVIANP